MCIRDRLNSGVTIEIQQTGSGAGIQSTTEGVCDIGMASRELKDEETSQGLKSEEIALDGIAVIVNTDNGVEDLSMDQIRSLIHISGRTSDQVRQRLPRS